MAKPIILTVDDEPQVLNAVERDLRRHYRGEYRIIKATSGVEALDAVRELKRRNAPIAPRSCRGCRNISVRQPGAPKKQSTSSRVTRNIKIPGCFL